MSTLTSTSTSCLHEPHCPAAGSSDQDAAHVVREHPEQGWSLLCNGVLLFEDGGDLCFRGSVACVTSAHRADCPRTHRSIE